MLVSDPVTRELISSHEVADALARPARLAALDRTRLLDSEPEEAFDRATRLATRLLNAPVSLVSLVTPERQFFKAQTGLGEPWATRRGTPLSHSFCQYVVATRGALVVNDARNDPLVRDNPAVTELGVRSYLGVPLRETDGEVLGAFCAVDTDPRAWTHDDLEALEDIAAALGTEVALRLRVAALSQCERDLGERHRETLRRSRELRHRAGNLLVIMTMIMKLDARRGSSLPFDLPALSDWVAALSRAHAACMEDDPDKNDLLKLLQSVVGAKPGVTIERGVPARLPDAAIASIVLVLYEWLDGLTDQATKARISWGRTGPDLHLRCYAPHQAPPPSAPRAALIEAAVRHLDGRIVRSGNGDVALVVPLSQ